MKNKGTNKIVITLWKYWHVIALALSLLVIVLVVCEWFGINLNLHISIIGVTIAAIYAFMSIMILQSIKNNQDNLNRLSIAYLIYVILANGYSIVTSTIYLPLINIGITALAVYFVINVHGK